MATLLERAPAPETVPWGNGLGLNRQLAAEFEEGGASSEMRPMIWRVSTTWIEQDCPFSNYGGYDREILLLSGEGFRLDHQNRQTSLVSPRHAFARFSGAWTTACVLLDGPVHVLNLMVSDRIGSFSLRHHEMSGKPKVFRFNPHAKVLVMLEGRVTVHGQDRAQPIEVMEGETWLFRGNGQTVPASIRSTGGIARFAVAAIDTTQQATRALPMR